MNCKICGTEINRTEDKKGKQQVLKIRLDTLIKQAGMSQRQFYRKLEISRQAWYYYSWGLWEMPIYLKIKVAQLLNTDTSLIFNKQEAQKND